MTLVHVIMNWYMGREIGFWSERTALVCESEAEHGLSLEDVEDCMKKHSVIFNKRYPSRFEKYMVYDEHGSHLLAGTFFGDEQTVEVWICTEWSDPTDPNDFREFINAIDRGRHRHRHDKESSSADTPSTSSATTATTVTTATTSAAATSAPGGPKML